MARLDYVLLLWQWVLEACNVRLIVKREIGALSDNCSNSDTAPATVNKNIW